MKPHDALREELQNGGRESCWKGRWKVNIKILSLITLFYFWPNYLLISYMHRIKRSPKKSHYLWISIPWDNMANLFSVSQLKNCILHAINMLKPVFTLVGVVN